MATMATLPASVSPADPLQHEAQRLRLENYQRGHPTACLVATLACQGFMRTALAIGDVRRGRQFSCSVVLGAEAFTRGRAPEHVRRVQGLLAILAIALARKDPRFAASFAPYLGVRAHWGRSGAARVAA